MFTLTLAQISAIRHDCHNMSMRDSRNKLFARVTPDAWQIRFTEQGREIANGISLGRAALAPIIGLTAARGNKGVFPASLRVVKMASDGYDGFVAESDHHHKTANPKIKSGPKMLKAIVGELTSAREGKKKSAQLIEVLKNTDGSAIDRDFDKASQIADQLGCVANGDLKRSSFALNLARIGLIDFAVRPTYAALGVTKLGATPVSQAKTVVHDGHQLLESTGLLDRYPVGRRILETASNLMTVYSAIDIMKRCELQYRHDRGDNEEKPGALLCMYALSRTVHHITGITSTAFQPESTSNEAEQTYAEFQVLPPTASPHSLN